MSFKSLWAASIAASRERTNCQYVLLRSSQMYSTKYVVFVRLAVSIVFIVVVFLVPGTRRVGWVSSSTRIQRYNKKSNYQKKVDNFSKNLFRPLRKRFWPTGTGPDRPTLIFPGFSFYGPFGRRTVRWSILTGKRAKSPEMGQNGHKKNGRRFATLAAPKHNRL